MKDLYLLKVAEDLTSDNHYYEIFVCDGDFIEVWSPQGFRLFVAFIGDLFEIRDISFDFYDCKYQFTINKLKKALSNYYAKWCMNGY